MLQVNLSSEASIPDKTTSAETMTENAHVSQDMDESMADQRLQPLAGSMARRREVPLRISQIFSACTFCKARKMKCDGVAPFCGGCIKYGRRATCSLSNKESGHDYPTHLQRRIEKIQKELEDAGYATPVGQAPDHNDRSHSTEAVDTIVSDIGGLPILSFGSQSSLANGSMLSSLILAAASVTNEASETTSLVAQLSEASHANPEAFSQPPLDVATRLATHYFEQIYQRLPFFSIQGFWAQFAQVYPDHDPGDVGGDQSPSLSHCRFTVYLVLAIATSSLSRSTDSTTASEAQRLFRGALEFQQSALVPNIIGVQSMLFLIQFATLNPSILDAWYLISVGMRMCVDLGLHQDPRSPESAAPSLLETRRRLWWSMYSVDRSMNLGLGRPPEISDAVCNVALPSFRIEKSSTEAEILVYLQRYRVLQIQSRSQSRLSEAAKPDSEATISQLRSELSAWNERNTSLPKGDVLESEWLMGLMLLSCPCRLRPERTTEELEELWRSALSFNELYRKLVESNSIFYIRVACEKIYWTGLVVLLSYSKLHKTGSTTAPQPLDLWVAVKDVLLSLRALAERWEDGKLLYQSYNSVTDEFMTALQKGETGVPPQLQKILKMKKLAP